MKRNYCVHLSLLIFIVFFVFKVETRSVKGLVQSNVGKVIEDGEKTILQPASLKLETSNLKIDSQVSFKDYLSSLLRKEELQKKKGMKVLKHSRQKRKVKLIIKIFIKMLMKVFMMVSKMSFMARG